MKIGLDQYTLHHRVDLSGIEPLQLVQSYALDGLQFGTIRNVSPTLDLGEIRAVADYARQHDLYVEVGIPSPNPHLAREMALKDGDGDLRAGLRRHLEAIAVASVGSRAVRCFVGGPGDRHSRPVPWRQQLEDTIAVARDLIPTLRENNLILAFENHADATIDDLLSVIDAVGADAAGICLDTGNLLITLDDPLPAVMRAAPHTVATHFKDGIVAFADDGAVFNARPCGQGILPLTDIVRELARHNPDLIISIEDHGGLYSIPIFESGFLDTFPTLTPGELAHFVKTVWSCERAIAANTMVSPASVEAIPWAVRADDRIRESGAFVREVVADLTVQA